MDEQKKPVVNIGGVEYALDQLTPETQAQVALYQKWAAQLNELRNEYAKTDFAVRAIAAEITKAVQTESAPSDEQPE